MEGEVLKEEINSELTGFNKGDKEKKRKQIILGIVLGLIFIIVLVLIIVLARKSSGDNEEKTDPDKKDEEEEESKVLGEINCIYDVQTINFETLLFGKDFKKESDFDVYIDKKKIKNGKRRGFVLFSKWK